MRAQTCVLFTLELEQGSGPQVARRVLTEAPEGIRIMAVAVNATTVTVTVAKEIGLSNLMMDFFKELERSQAKSPKPLSPDEDNLDPSND